MISTKQNIYKLGKSFVSLAMVLLFALTPAFAQNEVTASLSSSQNVALQNIVTVAKANGDFTDPISANNAITDASATNPYLIVVGPGVYRLFQTLKMKRYVSIVGSGKRSTILRGTISGVDRPASRAVVWGANNASLSNMSVQNIGGGGFGTGIYTAGLNNSALLENLSLGVSGRAIDGYYGIYNKSSSPTISQVSVIVTSNTGSQNQ